MGEEDGGPRWAPARPRRAAGLTRLRRGDGERGLAFGLPSGRQEAAQPQEGGAHRSLGRGGKFLTW